MLLLRVQLPDRPGSLGSVATALGTAGADIAAIEIVEKAAGQAINDFMVTVPPGALLDNLISACTAIEGVRVLWMSRYPENWGLASDIDALNQMVAEPARAVQILVDAVPQVFHCQWAAVADADRRVLARSSLGPDFAEGLPQSLAPFDQLHSSELPADWLPGWGQTWVAVCPANNGLLIVLGRQGGPEFLESELRRVTHLTAMAR